MLEVFEELNKLDESRKEDEIYFQGPFWIIGDSQIEINKGNFEILDKLIPVDYNGNYLDTTPSTKGFTSHKKLWNDYKSKYNNVDYDYYPRGRVRIVNGEVFIHINSKMNTPKIINTIINKFGLQKLSDSINIEEDDLLQGSHYDFQLT